MQHKTSLSLLILKAEPLESIIIIQSNINLNMLTCTGARNVARVCRLFLDSMLAITSCFSPASSSGSFKVNLVES